MYEQLVVDGAIKTAPLGGVDLTRYMGDMLLSCKVLLLCPFGHSAYCLLAQIIARCGIQPMGGAKNFGVLTCDVA